MGNEHFWQARAPAKGVYARSITKHARRESQALRGCFQRTTRSDAKVGLRGDGISGPTGIAEIGDLDSRATCR